MNLKGIKIDKKIYKKISEIGANNLKTSILKGLDEFKEFTWSNFIKQEFAELIKTLDVFEKNGLFDNLNDRQVFIINYYTDVTEMDIATVLRDKDKNNIIVDIEYKAGLESETKLDEQILKRKHDHMQQLFLNERYILVAINDEGFYKANYYDSNENIDITKFSDLKEVFSSFESNENVESILTQANNLAGIHKLYSQMEEGKFKYYEETKRATEFILSKINDGRKAVVCLSSPGTGKTVAAFKLFFENEDIMFLIMNEKFYRTLGLIKYFVEGRCFFGSDAFLQKDLSDKIVLIDEAQRLSKETLLEIIKASKGTIIFGDTNQAFMPKDLSLNGHEFIKYLREKGIYVHKKELKRSKRYSDSVENALNYLVSKSNSINEKIRIDDYIINLFYDSNDFLNEYHSCKGFKKMFTTFDCRKSESIIIGNEIFSIADKDLYSYAVVSGLENYIGHTLHAISFDVENNFIYLQNVCIKQRKGKDILTLKEIDISNEEGITKFLNELNILFTRGQKSLNILATDFEVYLYLNKKLKDIKY